MNKNFIKTHKHLLSLIFILAGLLLPGRAQGDAKRLVTYYPALTGEYERIRLMPRVGQADLTATALNPCTIGTLYSNKDGILKYCFNDGTNKGLWGSVPDIWLQNIDNNRSLDNIYLTDTAANSQLRVGLGNSTPVFKLTIQDNPTIIAKGTYGAGANLSGVNFGTKNSRFIWHPRKAAFRAGQVDGTQWDEGSIGNYSVAMGKNTLASSTGATIGGGESNSVGAALATILGGKGNTANGAYAAIGGGQNNVANGNYSLVYGGLNNQATSVISLVIGGRNNQATGIAAIVGGGESNRSSVNYGIIGGGSNNLLDRLNDGTSGVGYAIVGGGQFNAARHDYAIVGGGQNNSARGYFATIGGGDTNIIGDLLGVLGRFSTISGGQGNSILSDLSTIVGGKNNSTSALYSVIGGGQQNIASGNYSMVSGGERNGSRTTLSGIYSMIMGGTDNVTGGDYSWAGGRNVRLTSDADHTFAWGYSDENANPITISRADSFIIAPGRINGADWNPKLGIRTVSPAAVLEINANSTNDDYLSIYNNNSNILTIKNNGAFSSVYIGVGNNRESPTNPTYVMQFSNANNAYLTGTGIWTSTSSKKYKEHIRPLSSYDAQKALDDLNPVTFNYRVSPDRKNVGFIAEEVPALVAMNDRKTLSALDIVAVLTQTVKDQEEQIQIQNQRFENIQKRILELKNKLGE